MIRRTSESSLDVCSELSLYTFAFGPINTEILAEWSQCAGIGHNWGRKKLKGDRGLQ